MENINTQAPARPVNNLGKAIAAIVLFWPCGIPALINATKVDRLYNKANYEAALNASRQAGKWGKIGIIIGIILGAINLAFLFVIYFVYFAMLIGMSAAF